jgi:hypothetical protein
LPAVLAWLIHGIMQCVMCRWWYMFVQYVNGCSECSHGANEEAWCSAHSVLQTWKLTMKTFWGEKSVVVVGAYVWVVFFVVIASCILQMQMHFAVWIVYLLNNGWKKLNLAGIMLTRTYSMQQLNKSLFEGWNFLAEIKVHLDNVLLTWN